MKKGKIFSKPNLPLSPYALATSLYWADVKEDGSLTADIEPLEPRLTAEGLQGYRRAECVY
jgi:hypothetical protein